MAGQKPDRVAVPFRVSRQHRQEPLDIPGLRSLEEGHGPQLVLVQSLGQVAHDRVPGVGHDALDDQLPVCHPDRERASALQHLAESPDDILYDGTQRRVTRRVHGVTMHPDREFQKELAQLTREGGACLRWRGGGLLWHVPRPLRFVEGAGGNPEAWRNVRSPTHENTPVRPNRRRRGALLS